MAHGHGGEGGRAQQFFQPLDSGQVQMVGRLIQQHHLRLDDHGLGNGQPLAPSAGERSRLRVQVGKAGASGQLPQPALALGLVYMGCGKGAAPAPGEWSGPERSASPAAHRRRGRACARPARPRPAPPAQPARQQRGLARAVGADQPDAVAVLHGQGNIAKQRHSAELLGHGLRIENRRHLSQDYRVLRTRAQPRNRSAVRLRRPAWRSRFRGRVSQAHGRPLRMDGLLYALIPGKLKISAK